jgi:isopenicillin-N N-acyltransferase-like protein
MGRTHGRTLRPEIRELVNRWKADLEKTYSVPAAAYIERLLQTSDLKPAIERWTPGLLDEVRGIADGADIDFRTMFAYQLIDETWVMGCDLDLAKCTSIGAQKRSGQPAFVAQNLDLPVFYNDYPTILHLRGRGEPEAFVFTIPGVIAANGLNDCSVGVCVNAVTQLAYSAKGLPVDFVIRGILRLRTYGDAVRFLKEIRPAAPQNYVIGGPEQAAGFERSADRMAEFRPFPEAEFTFHTNHPLVNEDFNPRFRAQLEKSGMSLATYQSVCPRFRFLEASFKDNSAVIDLDVLKRLFADRGSGINNERTYGCTIMVLGEHPKLHIAPGRPDEAPFQVLEFERRQE